MPFGVHTPHALYQSVLYDFPIAFQPSLLQLQPGLHLFRPAIQLFLQETLLYLQVFLQILNERLQLFPRPHCVLLPVTFYCIFAQTSSMLPTLRKYPSGTSSCLPSRISLNPLIVSEIGTYFPSSPVNCPATKNGCERNL